MLSNVSKLIVKAGFGIMVILLLVESSLIMPAYFSIVFNSHAIASKGARNNYISASDVDLLIKNITTDGTNKRFDTVLVNTTVQEIQAEGNTSYNRDDIYNQALTDAQTLQRGDSFVLHVEATYYFLTPNVWTTRTINERKAGIPITLSYDVPIICIKYLKR